MTERWEDEFVDSYAKVRPEEFDEFHEEDEDETNLDLDLDLDQEELDEIDRTNKSNDDEEDEDHWDGEESCPFDEEPEELFF